MKSVDPVKLWHPIPFTDPLVLRIMDGTKTITRRPFKPGRAWVRMKQTVEPDKPFGLNMAAGVEPCYEGRKYAADLGGSGAAMAVTRERAPEREGRRWRQTLLGLKPLEFDWVSPWGAAGENMWLREAHKITEVGSSDFFELTWRPDGKTRRIYEGDEGYETCKRVAVMEHKAKWRPPMFMFRWCSRISLRLLEVGVQRLQDITEAEAQAEGMTFDGKYWQGAPHKIKGTPRCFPTAREAFCDVWRHIYGQHSMESNDWVWRLRFEKL
jgi:hypothetical protein